MHRKFPMQLGKKKKKKEKKKKEQSYWWSKFGDITGKQKVNANYVKNINKLLTTQHHMSHFGKVCTHLHYSVCKKLGTESAEYKYTHIHKAACEHEDITIL